MNLLVVAAQMIHCKVTDRTTATEQLVTIIYGFNTVEQVILMGCIDYIGPFNQPPLVGGWDFNAVLYPIDRLGGSPISASKIKDFEDCILNLGLNELHWSGQYYTWSNK